MGRLDGKIAIVTGGARGMGEAESRLFAAEGAKVMIADVLGDDAAAVAGSIGAAARSMVVDVTDEASWKALLTATIDAFGVPDILVNNAGILRPARIIDLDVADLHAILDVNLVGPILGMKTVGGAMCDAGHGSIVNVSSTGGMVGMSMIGAYVASKWGLRGVSKSAAIEFGPQGVRVNTLHPGGVATPMVGVMGHVMEEPPPPGQVSSDPVLAGSDAISSAQPIGRIGRPIEIARLALFLASDESSYCTGMEFVADGGAVAGQDLSASFG